MGTSIIPYISYIIATCFVHLAVAGQINVYFVENTALQENYFEYSLILIYNLLSAVVLIAVLLLYRGPARLAIPIVLLSCSIIFFMMQTYFMDKDAFTASQTVIHYIALIPIFIVSTLQILILRRGKSKGKSDNA